MMITNARIAVLISFTTAIAACDARPGGDAPPVDAPRDGAVAEVDEQLLQELKARYPSLREDTAPEPQPNNGARADNIPQSVRQTAPGTVLRTVTGEATFYADHFEGRRTASGIPFRQNQMVAAHRGFPFGTLLRVTNLANGRSANVRVVDRGPFGAGAKAKRTVIDLSRRAAQQLGYIAAGRAQVRVQVLEWGEGLPAAG
jgi:rare lipoprotein A